MWTKGKLVFYKNKVFQNINFLIRKINISTKIKWLYENIKFIFYKAFKLEFIIIFVVIVIITWILIEANKDEIFIDPISSPSSYNSEGYNPRVIANKIRDEIKNIQTAARIRSKKFIPVESDWTLYNIQVPVVDASIRTLIQLTRTFLNLPETHIKGEITLPLVKKERPTYCKQTKINNNVVEGNSLLLLTLRVEGKRVPPIHICENRIDLLVRDAALELLRQLDPVILATYWMDIDRQRHKFDTTFSLIQEILNNDDVEDDKYAYNLKGYIQANYLNKPYDAINNFNTAIELDKKFANPYFNLAFLLAQVGRHKKAIEIYKKEILLKPKDAWAYNNTGVSYGKIGNHKEAIKYFNKAIEIDPKNIRFYYNLKYALRKLNRNKEADEVLNKYRKVINSEN